MRDQIFVQIAGKLAHNFSGNMCRYNHRIMISERRTSGF